MRLAALALTLSLLSTAAYADCLKANSEDQVAVGRLASVVASVPAYALKEQAYILRLAAPVCLDGDDEYDKVEKSDRIHVYSTDDKLLKRCANWWERWCACAARRSAKRTRIIMRRSSWALARSSRC
jgi:hypothetical protein